MLKVGNALFGDLSDLSDLGDVVARDPEVRQAQTIAEAARSRLVACMTGSEDGIDPTEAQRMLDAFRNAKAHAEDAEDRVLVHRGLLTSAEAGRRAARRCQVTPRADRLPRAEAPARAGGRVRSSPFGPGSVSRTSVTRGIAGALALVVVGVAGAVIARRPGVRPPLARW